MWRDCLECRGGFWHSDDTVDKCAQCLGLRLKIDSRGHIVWA